MPPVDPAAARTAAAGLRDLVDALTEAGRAAERLVAATGPESWDGLAADVFRSALGERPSAAACFAAADAMSAGAAALERFADAVDVPLAELGRLHRFAVSLGPVALAEPIPAMAVALEQAAAAAALARAAIADAASRLHDQFDVLDDATTFATAPPSLAGQVRSRTFDVVRVTREAAFGTLASLTGLVTDLPQMARVVVVLQNPVLLAGWAVHNREEIEQVALAFREDPGGMSLAVGQALIDWDTLQENPARWVGSVVPEVAIAIGTFGSGTAVTASSRAARTAGRLDDVGDAARAARRVTDATGVGLVASTAGAPAVRAQTLTGRAVAALDRAVPMLGRGRQLPGGAKDIVDGRYTRLLDRVGGSSSRPGHRGLVRALDGRLARRAVLGRVPGYAVARDLDRLVAGVPAMTAAGHAVVAGVHTASLLERAGTPAQLAQTWNETAVVAASRAESGEVTAADRGPGD